MSTREIINKLSELEVSQHHCTKLGIICHGKPDLVIPMVVTDIIKDSVNLINEELVRDLLIQLIKNEFNQK